MNVTESKYQASNQILEIYFHVPKNDPKAVMGYVLRKLEGDALLPMPSRVQGSVIGSEEVVLEQPTLDALVRTIEEKGEGAKRVEVFGVELSNDRYVQLPSGKPLTLIFYE